MHRRLICITAALTCLAAPRPTDGVLISPDVLVNPGASTTLVCPPVAMATTTLWIAPSGLNVTADERHIVGQGTLNITSVGETDVGKYKCLSYGQNGNLLQEEVIMLYSSPYVLRMTKSMNLVVGETAVVSCSAWGFPQPTLHWFQLKGDVSNDLGTGDDDDDDDEGVDGDDDGDANGDDSVSVSGALTIANLSLEDYAVYECVATNLYGNASGSTLVRVKDVLAPLWPFLGICAEVLVLVIIILIYEKRKAKQSQADEAREKEATAGNQTSSADSKGGEGARFRK